MRFTIVAALLAAVALPALGQSSDAIVVDALRFSEDARRLPASVSVIGQDDIAKSAARTLPELLQEQVGITMKDFYGNNASVTSIDMRGFGVTGGQNTLVLIDGRRLSDADLTGPQWSSIPLAGIERIEIMRGAGSVLYGDGASAGVINIVTRSPLKEGAAAEAFGRAATFNTYEGQIYGSYATSKLTGNLGINASVYGYVSDGYRANNRNEQQNNNANLRWAVGANTLDLRFSTDNQSLGLPGARRIRPSTGLNEYAADPRGAQTPQDKSSQDGTRTGMTLAHQIGETELTLGLDWRDKKQNALFLQQFSAMETNLSVLSLTPRVRVPFQFGGFGHRLTAGADWHYWSYDSRRDNPTGNLGQPVNRVRATQRNEAIYVQDLIELTPATRLSAGWRSERVRYNATDTLDPTAPGFFGFQTAAAPAAATKRQDAWDLGLRHGFAPEWTGYARTGRAFRFANIDEIYDFDAFGNPQLQILKPQHSLTWEGGAEWRARGSFLRAGLFRIDITDEIHLDPFTAGIGNTNLPPSRRQGVELDSGWQATPSLRMTAGYAYTDARFREGTLPGGAFVIGTNLNIAGKHVPLVPKHKLNAGVAWDIGGGARLSSQVWATSSQFMDNDEPNTLGAKIPGVAVVDVKFAQAFNWGRISLAVNNLFDRSYYTYAIRSQFTADLYAVYPLPGRTVGLTAEFKM